MNMRDILNTLDAQTILSEARGVARSKLKVAAPVVDTESLLSTISMIEQKLNRFGHIEFSTKWVDMATAEVSAKKSTLDMQMANDREKYGDEEFDAEMYSFDPVETFHEVLPKIIERNSIYYQISGEVRQSEVEYQHSMMNDPDDLSDFVESSSYLTALAAQKRFASAEGAMNCGRVETYAPVLQAITNVIEAFEQFRVNSERFEPEFVPSFVADVECLIPLMKFVLINKI